MKALYSLLSASLLTACVGDDAIAPDPIHTRAADVDSALSRLAAAEVLEADTDGVVRALRGDLGRVTTATDPEVRAAARDALAAFRVTPDALALRKVNQGVGGRTYFRYQQTHAGLDVIGGDLVIAVDGAGTIFSIDGSARGDFPVAAVAIDAAGALDAIDADPRFQGLARRHLRQVYLHRGDLMVQAHEIEATGRRDGGPVRDLVYVGVDRGDIVAVHPQVHSAKHRTTYTAQNGTALPGVVVRTEWSRPVGDIEIEGAHVNAGITYDAYLDFFQRDSWNGAGAEIKSSVHYDEGVCNAAWTGTQVIYGDGWYPGVCEGLAREIDVTAHELTHAVIETESQLIYDGESGAINESLADSFGVFVKSWSKSARMASLVVDEHTFLLGENVLPPFIRNLCDPKADFDSLDYYQPDAGTYNVHYSSGIGNLMFCLLVKGGEHPRVNNVINVPGIGLEKAIRIAYYAQVNILTASSNYLAYKNAMLAAAEALHGMWSTEYASVKKAFDAVGVDAPAFPQVKTLTNHILSKDNSGGVGTMTYFKIVVPPEATKLTVKTDGWGDADLYIRKGALPTLAQFECRGYAPTSYEKCVIDDPEPGSYYIMLHGYQSYSSTDLRATYLVDDGVPVLANNQIVTNLSAAKGETHYFKIVVPAGKQVKFETWGGSGNVVLDAYTAVKPTSAFTVCYHNYDITTQTCTYKALQDEEVWYVAVGAGLYVWAGYTGVSLKASYF